MKSRVQGAAWGGASQEKRQVSQAKPQNARKGPKIVNLQPGLVYMPEALDMDTQKWLIGKEKRRYIYLSDTAFGVGKVEGGVGEGFYEEKDGRFVLNQGNRGRVIISPDTFPTSERFRTLCLTLLESARAVDTTLPMMEPNTALINYYNEKAFFKWHKDSEDPELIKQNLGKPIISLSIGLSGEFCYKTNYEDTEFKTVKLNSGDVLIFGGPSRMIVHSVNKIFSRTMPGPLLSTVMRSGRLNITVRDIGTGTIDKSQYPKYRVLYPNSTDQDFEA